jgi:hypothetical protein
VKVVGAGGTIAHVADDHDIVAADLRRHRSADRMADLGADDRAHPDVVPLLVGVVAGHLPALAAVQRVAHQLGDGFGQGQAAHHGGGTFAKRGKDPVAFMKRCDRTNGRGLLAQDRTVEADAALALQHQHAPVELPHLHHLLIEVEERVWGQLGVALGDDLAIGLEDGQQAGSGGRAAPAVASLGPPRSSPARR